MALVSLRALVSTNGRGNRFSILGACGAWIEAAREVGVLTRGARDRIGMFPECLASIEPDIDGPVQE